MAVRNISILILYNAEGKILLQHRAKDAVRLPYYWAFFGGGIEKGESPEGALKREAIEELGYAVKDPKPLTIQKFTYKEDENTKYVFVEKYNNQKLNLGEGQGMDWFLPKETSDLKMVDHDRPIIEKIKDFLNKRNNP